jgi:hypothetical protein
VEEMFRKFSSWKMTMPTPICWKGPDVEIQYDVEIAMSAEFVFKNLEPDDVIDGDAVLKVVLQHLNRNCGDAVSFGKAEQPVTKCLPVCGSTGGESGSNQVSIWVPVKLANISEENGTTFPHMQSIRDDMTSAITTTLGAELLECVAAAGGGCQRAGAKITFNGFKEATATAFPVAPLATPGWVVFLQCPQQDDACFAVEMSRCTLASLREEALARVRVYFPECDAEVMALSIDGKDLAAEDTMALCWNPLAPSSVPALVVDVAWSKEVVEPRLDSTTSNRDADADSFQEKPPLPGARLQQVVQDNAGDECSNQAVAAPLADANLASSLSKGTNGKQGLVASLRIESTAKESLSGSGDAEIPMKNRKLSVHFTTKTRFSFVSVRLSFPSFTHWLTDWSGPTVLTTPSFLPPFLPPFLPSLPFVFPSFSSFLLL